MLWLMQGKATRYQNRNNVAYSPDYSSVNYSVGLGIRYYYNLKKRIRNGMCANNLSADYFTFQCNYNVNTGNIAFIPILQNKCSGCHTSRSSRGPN